MPLFRDENPALGPTTSVKELSGYGAGNPVVNYFKPGTREMLALPLTATSTTQWVFQAPWKCQVIGVHVNFTVTSTSGTVDLVRIQADAVAPGTANGTTIISMLTAPQSLSGTANTRLNPAMSAAAGSPNVLNAGDQLAIVIAGTMTGLAGGYIQIEIAQIG